MTALSFAAMSRMTCASEMKMDSLSGRYWLEKKPLEYTALAARFCMKPLRTRCSLLAMNSSDRPLFCAARVMSFLS